MGIMNGVTSVLSNAVTRLSTGSAIGWLNFIPVPILSLFLVSIIQGHHRKMLQQSHRECRTDLANAIEEVLEKNISDSGICLLGPGYHIMWIIGLIALLLVSIIVWSAFVLLANTENFFKILLKLAKDPENMNRWNHQLLKAKHLFLVWHFRAAGKSKAYLVLFIYQTYFMAISCIVLPWLFLHLEMEVNQTKSEEWQDEVAMNLRMRSQGMPMPVGTGMPMPMEAVCYFIINASPEWSFFCRLPTDTLVWLAYATWWFLCAWLLFNLINSLFWLKCTMEMQCLEKRFSWIRENWMNTEEYSEEQMAQMPQFLSTFSISQMLLLYHLHCRINNSAVSRDIYTSLFKSWLELEMA